MKKTIIKSTVVRHQLTIISTAKSDNWTIQSYEFLLDLSPGILQFLFSIWSIYQAIRPTAYSVFIFYQDMVEVLNAGQEVLKFYCSIHFSIGKFLMRELLAI